MDKYLLPQNENDFLGESGASESCRGKTVLWLRSLAETLSRSSRLGLFAAPFFCREVEMDFVPSYSVLCSL